MLVRMAFFYFFVLRIDLARPSNLPNVPRWAPHYWWCERYDAQDIAKRACVITTEKKEPKLKRNSGHARQSERAKIIGTSFQRRDEVISGSKTGTFVAETSSGTTVTVTCMYSLFSKRRSHSSKNKQIKRFQFREMRNINLRVDQNFYLELRIQTDLSASKLSQDRHWCERYDAQDIAKRACVITTEKKEPKLKRNSGHARQSERAKIIGTSFQRRDEVISGSKTGTFVAETSSGTTVTVTCMYSLFSKRRSHSSKNKQIKRFQFREMRNINLRVDQNFYLELRIQTDLSASKLSQDRPCCSY